MDYKNIRWQQRYQNLLKAAQLLFKSIPRDIDNDELLAAGVVKTFEFTFELAWKTIKDYLESKGILELFPRDVIRKAFQNNIIQKGDVWLEMLKTRNMLVHTYDEQTLQLALASIKNDYIPEFKKLLNYLEKNYDL